MGGGFSITPPPELLGAIGSYLTEMSWGDRMSVVVIGRSDRLPTEVARVLCRFLVRNPNGLLQAARTPPPQVCSEALGYQGEVPAPYGSQSETPDSEEH